MRKALLFVCLALMLTVLSGCVGEKEMSLIYVSDVHNTRIVILDSDLNWVDSFDVVSSYALTVDSEHIYAERIQIDKYLRSSPYTLIDSGSVSGYDDIDSDEDYLYLRGMPGENIRIFKKSDLSLVDEFDSGHDWAVDALVVDDTYIYCYDANCDLKKLKKSDHSEVASVDIYDRDGIYTWFGMDKDSDYLYFIAGEIGNGELIAVYKKSDLSQFKVITIAATDYAWDLAVQGDYVYQVDYGAHMIRKVRISTGEVVATFGEEGVSGSDQSHLKYPDGIAIWPEEAQEVFGGYIG